MDRILVRHFASVLLGYLIYALVITCTSAITMFLFMTVRDIFLSLGNTGGLTAYFYYDGLLQWIFGLPVALFLIAFLGLPGWIISVVVAETRNERRKYWFALAGLLNVILGLFLIGEMDLRALGNMKFYLLLACGFHAGLTYWHYAGKHSGSWKRQSGVRMRAT